MGRKGAKKTRGKYQSDWEDSVLFPDFASWVQPVKTGKKDDDIHFFSCKHCRGRLSISNMGVTALRSHITGETHKKRAAGVINPDAFKAFRTPQTTPETLSLQVPEVPEAEPETSAALGQPSTSQTSTSTSQTSQKVTCYLNNAPTNVVKAWILWCLSTVYHHQSYNSAGNSGELFKEMFPDSAIAQSFGQLSRQKIAYMITHGLAPYFKKKIMDELSPSESTSCPLFTSCFDESFNEVTYSKQMDIHVIFFNKTTKLVERCYIGSQFMGHGTHKNTLDDFISAHNELDIVHNLVQVSMDGPNVNWKFLNVLAEHRKSEDPGSPSLLNIGSCGLHVVHGAYGTGQNMTDWEMAKTLKAAHGIFKNSPARRSDYLDDNNIENNQNDQSLKSNFPLKFCGHRWLENGKCLTRLIEIMDQLSLFLKKSKEEERKNFGAKDERFPLLLKNTSSVIFPAYCEFSNAICRDLEPFLKLFQAERPLGVFLFRKLKDMIAMLLERIVRKEVLDENRTSSKLLNLVKKLGEGKSSEMFLPLESIEVGFATKTVLRRLKTTQKSLEKGFRENIQKFLIRMLQKIVERSPLKYRLTRSMASLSPIEISLMTDETLMGWFESLVTELHDSNWITSLEAEKAMKQYKGLIKDKDILRELKKFNIVEDRVDRLYSEILGTESPELSKVVRVILILSHGNARVESGFSINGDILLPNMMEDTVIAQRLVYEGIHKAGGVTHVVITDEMVKMVRNSYRMYKAEGKKKEDLRSEGQKRISAKRKATNNLNKAVAGKKKVIDEMKKKMSETISQYDAEISTLQEEVARK